MNADADLLPVEGTRLDMILDVREQRRTHREIRWTLEVEHSRGVRPKPLASSTKRAR